MHYIIYIIDLYTTNYHIFTLYYVIFQMYWLFLIINIRKFCETESYLTHQTLKLFFQYFLNIKKLLLFNFQNFHFSKKKIFQRTSQSKIKVKPCSILITSHLTVKLLGHQTRMYNFYILVGISLKFQVETMAFFYNHNNKNQIRIIK